MSLSLQLCLDMLDEFFSDVSKIFFNPDSPTTLIITTAVVTTVVILTCYKMDLMRFIHDGYKGNGQTNAENKEKLKEIYKQKDAIIKKLETKISELEAQLQTKNPADPKKKDEILVTLHRYEDLIARVMTDNDIMGHENKLLKQRVADLDESMKGLMEKYEKAKLVIDGMKENEASLNAQKVKYEKFIKVLEEKLLQERKKNKSFGDCPSKASIYKIARSPSSGRF